MKVGAMTSVPAQKMITSMAFPYYVGPATRQFSTALLYFGEMTVTMPGWVSNKPLQAFFEIGDQADKSTSPLLPVFIAARHHFDLAQKQALSEVESLKPLGDKIKRALTVGPGMESHYETLRKYHDPCLYIAAESLQNPQMMNVAALEFIWRVYECFLEEKGDSHKVLTILTHRAKSLGGDTLLLAECLLNRMMVAKVPVVALCTDSQETMAILSHIGSEMPAPEDVSELQVKEVAFTLFGSVTSQYSPKLSGDGASKLAKLTDARSAELSALRKKCTTEAKNLLSEQISERKLPEAIENAIIRLKDEACAVAEIDERKFKDLLRQLSEDRVIWATVAGFLGLAATPLPAALAASLAITAFSSMGATALKSRSEARNTLKQSDMAFVYHLRNAFQNRR